MIVTTMKSNKVPNWGSMLALFVLTRRTTRRCETWWLWWWPSWWIIPAIATPINWRKVTVRPRSIVHHRHQNPRLPPPCWRGDDHLVVMEDSICEKDDASHGWAFCVLFGECKEGRSWLRRKGKKTRLLYLDLELKKE